MYTMLSPMFKPAVTSLITPIARAGLAIGLTPNAVSLIGALGVIGSTLWFYPRGQFVVGTLVATFFLLSDLFDGTMARLTHSEGTRWGAFIDSTLDRMADSSLLIGVAIYLHGEGNSLVTGVLFALLISFLIPYIRAKAEALSIACSVGIAERTERLIIILAGVGFEGFGVPYALEITIALLILLGLITIVQRVLVVSRALR